MASDRHTLRPLVVVFGACEDTHPPPMRGMGVAEKWVVVVSEPIGLYPSSPKPLSEKQSEMWVGENRVGGKS